MRMTFRVKGNITIILYRISAALTTVIFYVVKRSVNILISIIAVPVNLYNSRTVKAFFLNNRKEFAEIKGAVPREQAIRGNAVVAYMIVLYIIGKFLDKVIGVVAAAERLL